MNREDHVMSANPKKPFLLFGRFAVPLLFWVIIGPIAAVLSWFFMKKRANKNNPNMTIRPNLLHRS
jgi:hypothetical protein